MKRALATGVLLLAASVAGALTQAEIRCAVLGMGGGKSTSASHMLRSYVGPAVVGVSTAPGYELVHGPGPCGAPHPTAVGDETGIPAISNLHQNAPNPFNPQTTIQFDLPRDAARVRLTVYDLGGRLVRTLVDGPQPAGQQSVIWNGRDDDGRTVSSGVYVYELLAPDRRMTRKMTLLK
jgi:hypothetical protein